MKHLVWATIVLLSLSAVAEDKAKPSWNVKMGELSEALADAVPYLFPDPKLDPKGLSGKIDKISAIANQLDDKLLHSTKGFENDPTLPYIARQLKEDLTRAQLSAKEGHMEYAKSVVRSSVGYCIACHTSSPKGVEFPLLQAFAEPLKRASWIERIEFQSASRQFDPVIKEVMTKLERPELIGVSALDLERGTRIALSILIRVKNDPKRALSLSKAILKSPHATFSMKEGAKVWVKDLERWIAEKPAKATEDQELIKQARALIGKDQDAYLAGHSEVDFLRATVLMHELMKRTPNSEHLPEALYIIGVSYEALKELGLWSLHEMYYVTCIQKAPHTAQAERCFKRYKESITLGYSGSSGIHIPSAVQKHLNRMRDLAKAK